MPGSVWMGSSGCLLPFLIIFNLFFGRLIFPSLRLWLGIEVILILIFIFKINIMAQKINQQFHSEDRDGVSNNSSHKSNSKIIDVQGQVIEEKEKLK